MKKLNLEELHNYIGYVVKINNILYTLVDISKDNNIVVCSEDGNELLTVKVYDKIEIYDFKDGFSIKDLLTTPERIGYTREKFRSSVYPLIRSKYVNDYYFEKGSVNVLKFLRYENKSTAIFRIDDIKSSWNVHIKGKDLNKDVYMSIVDELNTIFEMPAYLIPKINKDKSELSARLYVSEGYISRQREFNKLQEGSLVLGCNNILYLNKWGINSRFYVNGGVNGTGKTLLHCNDIFNLIENRIGTINNFCFRRSGSSLDCSGILLFNIPSKYKYDPLDEIHKLLHISNLKSIIGRKIGTYYISDISEKYLSKEYISLKEECIYDKLEFLKGIEDNVVLNKWYKSLNGIDYCVILNDGLELNALIEIPTYSAHNVCLYTSVYKYSIRKNKNGIQNPILSNKPIFMYKDNVMKKELYNKYKGNLELLRDPDIKDSVETGYSCGEYYVFLVEDGSKSLKIHLCLPERKLYYSLIADKESKKVLLGDAPIGFKKSELNGIIVSLVNTDKEILKPKDTKYVIYNYNEIEDKVEIGKNKPIDTCYNIGDCIEICKKRNGYVFLIIEYTKQSICAYKKLNLLGNGKYLIADVNGEVMI